MQTDDNHPKSKTLYYGTKVYYLTSFSVNKAIPVQKQPSYADENIKEDKDK